MHLSVFPGGHDLDRVPAGEQRVPTSLLAGVRADAWDAARVGAAHASIERGDRPEPVWLHSDRPGAYALVGGAHTLAAMRRRTEDRALPLRLTHHPRWRSVRLPGDELVVLDPLPRPNPARPRAAPSGAPMRPVDLAGVLGAPPRTPPPGAFGVLGAEEAISALVAAGAVPPTWQELRWTPAMSDRAVAAHPDQAADAFAAAACLGAVERAGAELDRLGAALAPWGVRPGPTRTLLVRRGAAFEEAAASGLMVVGPQGDTLALLGLLVLLVAHDAERAQAEAVAAPLAQGPWGGASASGAPRLDALVRAAWLWDALASRAAVVPGVRGTGPLAHLATRCAGAPWADLSNPFPHAVAAFATGLVPVALDGRGALLAVPA